MDYIFIDTSIFEANNFLESKRINEILRLSEQEYIKIILPELTYKEILNRLKVNIVEAAQKYKKYRNDTRILRNIESLNGKFEPINVDECIEQMEQKITERFKRAKIEIIGYPTISIKDVFDSYFEKKPPFGSGIKKNEFPDAFALLSIEKWCIDNKKKCIVFAKDNDIIHFQSVHLDIVEDYEKYLNDKLIVIEGQKRMKRFEELYCSKEEELLIEVKNWVNDELDDFSKYYHYSNYMDVHDIDIQEVNVDLDEYQITRVTDKIISIQTKANIDFKVEIVIDDENYAIKDDDTKTWHFMDTRIELIEENRTIFIDLNYEIPAAGEEFIELVIEEINGGRELRI